MIKIVLGIFIIIIFFLLGLVIGKYKERSLNLKKLKEARKDAVKRSRAVLNGQLSEQLAPFFPDFPAHPTEIRFIGQPIDYIAFNGSSQGTITDISFIEVKTGSSSLSAVERSLKDVVEKKKINYIEYRADFNNK
ncbi:Holliday junction resolvase-like protein [Treponema putidum]|uniref:Holliday junction resolvase-related domain-containing protein n=1 Tax=Treponema putidum TaxID=221027 RepID=A0AAE9SGK5_9SPIR|nr:Holliday junction resolvase-like protein [Treponema putidum]AIN93930.1 hypothetical protein JO40_07270 [Treponema putidum]TWI78080.1 Holliday junction resolvase-like endonuclease [Treponema putidum]UTY27866.1 hypothetical protein E4N76_01870 [Treponema putidum]UTY30316.1 hypothetical protein E4N75_01185 [Treponema putidum]UTY32778.1 hypothetical protein E4N74_01220 [Treponema putidum]